MAYTSWTEQWLAVWNNEKYRIDVLWGYRQNPATNKTEYRATKLRVTSLTQYHSFNTGSLVAGVAVHTNTRKTKNFGNQTVSIGGTTTFDCTDDSREFQHNANGDVPASSVYLHFYCVAGINQYNTPEVGWTTVEIKNHIPKIDRVAPVATAVIESIQTNSVSLKVTSDSKTQYARYSVDGGATWEYVVPPAELQVAYGGAGIQEITSLKPGTEYNLIWQVRRDYNEVWSNQVKVEFITLSGQASAYIKQNGLWKKAKVWLKNGTWKKVKEIHAKVNGVWR